VFRSPSPDPAGEKQARLMYQMKKGKDMISFPFLSFVIRLWFPRMSVHGQWLRQPQDHMGSKTLSIEGLPPPF